MWLYSIWNFRVIFGNLKRLVWRLRSLSNRVFLAYTPTLELVFFGGRRGVEAPKTRLRPPTGPPIVWNMLTMLLQFGSQSHSIHLFLLRDLRKSTSARLIFNTVKTSFATAWLSSFFSAPFILSIFSLCIIYMCIFASIFHQIERALSCFGSLPFSSRLFPLSLSSRR